MASSKIPALPIGSVYFFSKKTKGGTSFPVPPFGG
jgi:hypothetical protein